MTTLTAVRTSPAGRLDGFRRFVSGLLPGWFWAIAVWIVVGSVFGPPRPLWFAVAALLLVLAFVRPPHVAYEPVQVQPPVRGRWTAINSPATTVPSHGVRAYGQTYAVDILHPRPPGTLPKVGWTNGFRRPETFSAFGEPVRAVADGTVVRVLDRMRDHRSRSSWPALIYMMTIEGLRDFGGASAVIGNHVVVDHGRGVYSLVAHLRRGSVRVRAGQQVAAGDVLGEVGNSGNTSEPHLHVQLMDQARPQRAAGIPFRWSDLDISADVVDGSWSARPVSRAIEPGVPANGQVFDA